MSYYVEDPLSSKSSETDLKRYQVSKWRDGDEAGAFKNEVFSTIMKNSQLNFFNE